MKASISLTKKLICLLLCVAIMFSFAGCSSKKLTEENITKTVEKAESALIDLNIATIKKHIKFNSFDNSNVKINYKNIGGKKELIKLGKALFENLSIEVVSVNLEEKTVDVDITNKVLYLTTDNFLSNLMKRNSYTQLLMKITEDEFVKANVDEYLNLITDIPISTSPKRITLKVEQDGNNIVLVFDEEALAAITGEAFIPFSKYFFLG